MPKYGKSVRPESGAGNGGLGQYFKPHSPPKIGPIREGPQGRKMAAGAPGTSLASAGHNSFSQPGSGGTGERSQLSPVTSGSSPQSPQPGGSGPYSPHRHSALPVQGVPSDVALMLQDIPTKADLAVFVAEIKLSLRQDLQEIRRDIGGLATKVAGQETAQTLLTHRVASLETEMAERRQWETQTLLQLDDLENRSRRNNVKIRGLPEATRAENLKVTVMTILNLFLDRDVSTEIELDRVHRVGPIADGTQRPRDVLCRIHFFALKEEVLRQAWQKKSVNLDGADVHILPDLSRRTLQMRRSLKPLLDLIGTCGGSYIWGYPLHLMIRYRNRSFALHTSAQLPALFDFLETHPIDVPDWLRLDSPPSLLFSSQQGRGRPSRRERRGPRSGSQMTSPGAARRNRSAYRRSTDRSRPDPEPPAANHEM